MYSSLLRQTNIPLEQDPLSSSCQSLSTFDNNPCPKATVAGRANSIYPNVQINTQAFSHKVFLNLLSNIIHLHISFSQGNQVVPANRLSFSKIEILGYWYHTMWTTPSRYTETRPSQCKFSILNSHKLMLSPCAGYY